MTQLSLSLAAPATVLVRWAVASPTWPARADIPVVRARTAQEAAGLVHEERGAAATTAYCVEVAPGQWERVRIERARPAKGRE